MDRNQRRRAFGQHFLKDKSLCQSMVMTFVQKVSELGCKNILEIGPGKGAITEPLIEAVKASQVEKVTLVEKDWEFAKTWQEKMATGDLQVNVVDGDFLEIPTTAWLTEAPLAVISNLPYSAGTAILVELASQLDHIPYMMLMFQAEVAQRLRAQPSTKDWGSLSVWVQNRWEVRKFATVSAGAFAPPPKVSSEVVTLIPRAIPQVDVPQEPRGEELWNQLLKATFAHRRKMLRSSLSGQWKTVLEKAGVDGTLRAEALGWEDWRRLYAALVEISR